MIRELSPKDAAAFVELRRRALSTDPLAFSASVEDDSALSLRFVKRRLAKSSPEDSVILGAFVADLVGCIGLAREHEEKASHKAHVWGLYVAPEHRCSGIGRSLVVSIVERARCIRRLEQLQLSVSSASKPALRLYESVGFKRFGFEPRALRVGATYADEYHLALDLNKTVV